MQVEQIPTSQLVPYARNSRTHSDEQVAQIMASIREFGFCNPVLIDGENGIIAGHGRVMAASRMKLESVPCVRLSHLSESQKRAYVIADNRIALNAGWDDEMLSLELQELHTDDFDVGKLGFDVDELAKLLELDDLNTECNSGDIDAVPQVDRLEELQRQWGTKSGQLWSLGSHRLLCGDSTKAEDVAMLMGGARADLCFTSPPYGQQREYTKDSDCSDWDKLMQGVFANLPMSDAGQVLVNLGLIHRDGELIPYWDGWIEWMRSNGWKRFGWYVWDQGSGLPGDWNGRFAPSHEFIFHFNAHAAKPLKTVRKSENSGPMGSNLRSADGKNKTPSSICMDTNKIHDSVFRINRNSAHGTGHPATFPVALAVDVLQCWIGIVFEPFCGAGSTLIAAEQLGRTCYGMEISPAYVAVILQRFQDATGKTPVLVNNVGTD